MYIGKGNIQKSGLSRRKVFRGKGVGGNRDEYYRVAAWAGKTCQGRTGAEACPGLKGEKKRGRCNRGVVGKQRRNVKDVEKTVGEGKCWAEGTGQVRYNGFVAKKESLLARTGSIGETGEK